MIQIVLLNDSYTIHPIDCLLNKQLSDGSFPSGYNAEYTTDRSS